MPLVSLTGVNTERLCMVIELLPFGDSIVFFETEKIHKPMNFNVVNALIYMLADNQYLLQLFGIITVHANSLILRGLSQFYLPWLSKRQIPLS